MSRRRRQAVVLPVVAVLVAIASGCSGEPSSEVVVHAASGQVELDVGQLLVVDLGTINPSVGDGWTVVSEPDPSVLGPGQYESESLGEEGRLGAPSTARYSFEAVGAGQTTVELQFAYRGSTAEEDTRDRVEDAHVVLDVTVRPAA